MDDDVIIDFAPCAFDHVPVEDIYSALDTAHYDGEVIPHEEGDEGKCLLIGFDRSARPLEVMYNIVGERRVKVFHAMRLSKRYRPLIGGKR
jgi:hypothetical protein